MTTGNLTRLLAALWLALLPTTAHAEWRPVEKVETYAISGKSGAELYASIGERGPELGKSGLRSIAHTNFKLTWSRDYRAQGDSCTLASARPKLIITYMLPKPAGQLPALTRKNWNVFIEGVRKHELVHGDFITDMVREIERVSVGLTVSGDPDCQKIRKELTGHLSRLSHQQRQRSRDFDRDELSEGGNIHQLILRLVNGH
jgi:predicted secreted Zn-dependent protease